MKSITNRQEAMAFLAEVFQGAFTDVDDLSEHLAFQFAELNVLLCGDTSKQGGIGVSVACTAISNIVCHLDEQEKRVLQREFEEATPDLLRLILDNTPSLAHDAAA